MSAWPQTLNTVLLACWTLVFTYPPSCPWSSENPSSSSADSILFIFPSPVSHKNMRICKSATLSKSNSTCGSLSQEFTGKNALASTGSNAEWILTNFELTQKSRKRPWAIALHPKMWREEKAVIDFPPQLRGIVNVFNWCSEDAVQFILPQSSEEDATLQPRVSSICMTKNIEIQWRCSQS